LVSRKEVLAGRALFWFTSPAPTESPCPMAKPKKPAKKTSASMAPKGTAKPAKASAFKSTPEVKVLKVEKEIAAAKASAKGARKPMERLELPAPDFQEWGDNLKAYAHKNPAALVVGIIAVWMALVLLFD
jgi:hypothetical protein